MKRILFALALTAALLLPAPAAHAISANRWVMTCAVVVPTTTELNAGAQWYIALYGGTPNSHHDVKVNSGKVNDGIDTDENGWGRTYHTLADGLLPTSGEFTVTVLPNGGPAKSPTKCTGVVTP